MTTIQRKSAVSFSSRPVKVATRGHWVVSLELQNEGPGPWFVDLSHQPRWDLQDLNISQITPFGIAIPESAGGSHFEDGILVNRMNGTQASIWQIMGETARVLAGPSVTDVTDAGILLALTGPKVFSITEKLTSLDLADPGKRPPVLYQGPFSHVPCQIVVLKHNGMDGTVLFTCSRGYAHDMVHAVLDAGRGAGLRPAGENALTMSLSG